MQVKLSPPPGAVSWDEVRTRLDQNTPFSNMFDTPLYRDAVYEQFSRKEYARRYAALREKMLKLTPPGTTVAPNGWLRPAISEDRAFAGASRSRKTGSILLISHHCLKDLFSYGHAAMFLARLLEKSPFRGDHVHQ